MTASDKSLTDPKNLKRGKNRGESNINAKHTYEEIDAYCRRLASGESIMSIIRDEVGDPMARSYDHKYLYCLLHRLRDKQLWTEISTKYEYPKVARSVPNPIPGTGSFVYSEEFIRDVCEGINIGYSGVNIAKYIIYKYSMPLSALNKIMKLVSSIRRGESWLHISKEYPNIRKGFANYIRPIDPVEVCTMYENGYNQKEICEKLLGKKTSPEVKRIISNYRAMKSADQNTPIEMIHDPLLDLASA